MAVVGRRLIQEPFCFLGIVGIVFGLHPDGDVVGGIDVGVVPDEHKGVDVVVAFGGQCHEVQVVIGEGIGIGLFNLLVMPHVLAAGGVEDGRFHLAVVGEGVEAVGVVAYQLADVRQVAVVVIVLPEGSCRRVEVDGVEVLLVDGDGWLSCGDGQAAVGIGLHRSVLTVVVDVAAQKSVGHGVYGAVGGCAVGILY